MAPRTRVIVATFLNNAALGIFLLAFGKILFQTSGSVGQFTLFLIVEQVGLFLLGWIAGSAGRCFIAAHIASAANAGFALTCLLATVALAFGWFAPEGGGWLPAVTGLCFAASRAFFRPALFSLPSETVAPEALHRLNANQMVSINAGQLLGGASGGVMIELAGSIAALNVAVICYAASALLFAFTAAPYGSAKIPLDSLAYVLRQVLKDWGSAIAQVWRNPAARLTLMTIGGDFFTIAAFTLALPPLVAKYFDGSGFWLGWLESAFAFGAIVGGLLSGLVERYIDIPVQRVLALLLQAMVWPLFGMVVGGGPFLIISALIGVGVAMSTTTVTTQLQRLMPGKIHGQIAALRSMVIALTLLVLLPVFGGVIDTSIPKAAWLGAAVVLAYTGLFVLAHRYERSIPA